MFFLSQLCVNKALCRSLLLHSWVVVVAAVQPGVQTMEGHRAATAATAPTATATAATDTAAAGPLSYSIQQTWDGQPLNHSTQVIAVYHRVITPRGVKYSRLLGTFF